MTQTATTAPTGRLMALLLGIYDNWTTHDRRPVDSGKVARAQGITGILDALHYTGILAMDGLVTWSGCDDRYVVPTSLGVAVARGGQYRVCQYTEQAHSAINFADIHSMVRHWQQETDGITVFGDDSWPDLSAIPDSYIARGGNFFVAEDVATGVVLGFVGVRCDGGQRGALKRLAVRRMCRRRHIGTALVAAAVNWTRSSGFETLTVSTGVREHALPIYESAGFRMVRKGSEKRDHILELPLQADHGRPLFTGPSKGTRPNDHYNRPNHATGAVPKRTV